MSRKNIYPPRLADRFLQWFCSDEVLETLQGDLYELYEKRRERRGKLLADIYYAFDVLSALRPFAFEKKRSNSNYTGMLRHTFLISFRSFLRYKASFFINLTGLSIGLLSVILIYLWVHDEMSYDKFHVNNDRLFLIQRNINAGNGIITTPANSTLLPEALKSEMPGLEYVVPVRPVPPAVVSSEGEFMKANGWFVGKDFLNAFTYKIISGDPGKVLMDKYSMVISKELAIKLFGSPEKSLGKMLEWDLDGFGGTHIVSGVFEKPKANASEEFDFLVTYEAFLERNRMDVNWDSNPIMTYLTLKPGVDVDEFSIKLNDFYSEKRGLEIADFSHMFLQKFSDSYLYGRFENGVVTGGRIDYVILFSIIAGIILVIACINFMNLSTARASRRLKEVGIKKAFGVSKRAIALQYLSESTLLAIISLVIAFVLAFLLVPAFNSITGKHLTLAEDGWNLFFFGFSTVLITGLISGSYPALYLSGLKVVETLKGKLHTRGGELWIRKGLVVFQFAISILLITGVAVVYMQLHLVQTKNLGFRKDHVLTFSWPRKQNQDMQLFLEEVRNTPGVVNASSTSEPIVDVRSTSGGHAWQGQTPSENEIQFAGLNVGYDAFETLGIEVTKGRVFSKEFGDEENSIVLNEKAIESMGLEDPVGKWMELFGRRHKIIGVVKDFHFQSMHESIKPMFVVLNPKYTGVVNIRVKAESGSETIAAIQDRYQEHNAGVPFEFKFLDDAYQSLYASEQRVADLSGYFASIAIVLSCLGLFGMAAFAAERRQKEIGIRKVLGAGVFSIIKLLSGDFAKMVVLAIVISLPVSYLIAKEWLDSFAYRIALEWWFFASAGLVALLIASVSVGSQTLKAATANPVKSLKTE
jgi:putative ABC transport system permease protein